MAFDMKNFAGEHDSAAESQQVGANSYQRETHYDEVEVDQGILDQVQAQNNPEPVMEEAPQAPPEPSQQELNFKALRDEVDRIKAERDDFRLNLELLRNNVQQQQQHQTPRKEPEKFLDGLSDNDIPNVAELRKAFEQRESQYQAHLEELTVQQQFPDYAEVLEKYTAPLLKQKPNFAEGIMGARNKALFAYELGKMAQAQQTVNTPAPTQPSAIAQKIVDNARKPRTLSQGGGQSVLSQADYYANMSDSDFMKFASKNLEAI